MMKKLIFAALVLALAVAFAGTVTGIANYKVTLLQPSVVNGNQLQAGEYRLSVLNEKAKFVNGKLAVEVPVKVESSESKFDNTAIRYTEVQGKAVIAEIRVGGTKTRLVFN